MLLEVPRPSALIVVGYTWTCRTTIYTNYTMNEQLVKARFPLPEFTARVDGCKKMHQSFRAVNSARELGPSFSGYG